MEIRISFREMRELTLFLFSILFAAALAMMGIHPEQAAENFASWFIHYPKMASWIISHGDIFYYAPETLGVLAVGCFVVFVSMSGLELRRT